MYSAYKLNKQGENIQPSRTPFSIWNQSAVPCPVLIAASWPAYRFLRWQVKWSGIPIFLRIFQFVVIHTVKSFGIINKAEVDVFLELSCFLDNPGDVGSLISGSSGFSQSSFNIWKFTVHILLKPGLENFKHYFASVWDECNSVVVWTFFVIVSIHNRLTSEDPAPLPVKLKCLCSIYREIIWPYPPVSGCKKEEINTSLPEAGHSWTCFARLTDLFTLLCQCLSLCILPFYFGSSPLLSLVL